MTMALPAAATAPGDLDRRHRDRARRCSGAATGMPPPTLGDRALDRATATLAARGATIACDRIRRLPASPRSQMRAEQLHRCRARHLGRHRWRLAHRSALLAGRGGGESRRPVRRRRAVRRLALTASWSSASANRRGRPQRPQPGRRVGRRVSTSRAATTRLACHSSISASPRRFRRGARRRRRLSAHALAKGLALVLKKERTLPPIDADMQFTALDLGSSLGKNPQATIKAWLTGGGTLQVDRLKIASGEISAAASGRPLALRRGARLRQPHGPPGRPRRGAGDRRDDPPRRRRQDRHHHRRDRDGGKAGPRRRQAGGRSAAHDSETAWSRSGSSRSAESPPVGSGCRFGSPLPGWRPKSAAGGLLARRR